MSNWDLLGLNTSCHCLDHSDSVAGTSLSDCATVVRSAAELTIDHIVASSADRYSMFLMLSGMSFTNILKSMESRILSCGTSTVTGRKQEEAPLTEIN